MEREDGVALTLVDETRLVWSESVDKLIPAVLRARAAVPELAKDVESLVKTKGGASYQVKSEDLADLIEAALPALLKNGVLWTADCRTTAKATTVYSYLIHESGQWMRCEVAFDRVGAAWDVGSALTFGRRYALRMQLGIQPHGADDDGRAAQRGAKEERRAEAARVLAQVETARDQEGRREAYRQALADAGWDAAKAKTEALGFARGCFQRPPSDLTGPQFGVLLDWLRNGGSLPEDYDDPLLPAADLTAVQQWLGEGAEVDESASRALLRDACGPEVGVEDGVAWAREVLDEDPADMSPGQRLDAVRLYLHLSGHPAVTAALGKLGRGDVTVGVGRLWAYLGDPAAVLDAPAAATVAKLEAIGTETKKGGA
jgi:hypothetical protein